MHSVILWSPLHRPNLKLFGRVAAEALAMNTPVIASAHGGSLDIISDKANGYLFTPHQSTELTKAIHQCLPTTLTKCACISVLILVYQIWLHYM